MKTLFCKSLAEGELFKKCQKQKKRKLQCQIFAGVWCLLLTPFQKCGRGDVSSLPVLQCEFGVYVPDNLNHLLHKDEQQEGYLGMGHNDGILKHLAGWHSRSNIKWSLDNSPLGSTDVQLSLGSRNSFLAKAGSHQKGLLPPGHLWKMKETQQFSHKNGRKGSCSLSIFLPDIKIACHKVVSRTEGMHELKDSSVCRHLCHWLQKESQSARFCPSVVLLVSGTEEKLSLKPSGKRLEYVHITVDICPGGRGQNQGLPVCHTSKGDALVSACAARQKQMPSGNLQMRAKTFRSYSVKCHYTRALKQSIQHK